MQTPSPHGPPPAPRPPLPVLGSAQGRDAESPPWGQRDGVCCRQLWGQRRRLPCASPSLPGTFLVSGRVRWRLKEEEPVTLFQAAVSPCHVGKMLGTTVKGLEPSWTSASATLHPQERQILGGYGSSYQSICLSWKRQLRCLRDENTSSAAPPPPDIWESRAAAPWSFPALLIGAITHAAHRAERR